MLLQESESISISYSVCACLYIHWWCSLADNTYDVHLGTLFTIEWVYLLVGAWYYYCTYNKSMNLWIYSCNILFKAWGQEWILGAAYIFVTMGLKTWQGLFLMVSQVDEHGIPSINLYLISSAFVPASCNLGILVRSAIFSPLTTQSDKDSSSFHCKSVNQPNNCHSCVGAANLTGWTQLWWYPFAKFVDLFRNTPWLPLVLPSWEIGLSSCVLCSAG